MLHPILISLGLAVTTIPLEAGPHRALQSAIPAGPEAATPEEPPNPLAPLAALEALEDGGSGEALAIEAAGRDTPDLSPRAAVQPPEAPLPILVVGDRVRLQAPSLGEKPVVGEILEAGAQDLLLVLRDGRVVRVDRHSIARLEVSTGTRDEGKPGALAGAVFGVPFGVLTAIGWVDLWGHGVDWDADIVGFVAVWVVASVAVMAGIGALIGHRSTVDVWREAPASRFRAHVTPTRGGASGLRSHSVSDGTARPTRVHTHGRGT